MAGHSPSGFSYKEQNPWFHQLWQVVQTLKLQSSPRPSHFHHHVWLLVWCTFYEMLCWFYARCNGTHLPKSSTFVHQSTEYLPKSLGDNQDIFLANVRWAFVFFLVSNGFCLGTLPWMPFLPSLFLIVESWTLTLTEASEACSSLDVVLGSFMTSWMSRRCALGFILVGVKTPGKVHHCYKFSPFVDNGSDHGSLESQSLRNGFITLSRLIHVNFFFSHLFLNFFRSLHDVLLLKHASFCQTGSV